MQCLAAAGRPGFSFQLCYRFAVGLWAGSCVFPSYPPRALSMETASFQGRGCFALCTAFSTEEPCSRPVKQVTAVRSCADSSTCLGSVLQLSGFAACVTQRCFSARRAFRKAVLISMEAVSVSTARQTARPRSHQGHFQPRCCQ